MLIGHVCVVCATLGELNEHNKDSWIKPNRQDPDPTTNVKLQVVLDATDEQLWSVMDKATYDAIVVMAGSESGKLQYWHDQEGSKGWRKEKPTKVEIHVPGVVHECSTLYMGPESDPHAAVDENYTPYGCKNVYVTGGAIFPSAGEFHGLVCGYLMGSGLRVNSSNRFLEPHFDDGRIRAGPRTQACEGKEIVVSRSPVYHYIVLAYSSQPHFKLNSDFS